MTLRSTLLLGAAIFAITCSSCVRDYTCQCKLKFSGAPNLPDSSIREYNIRDKKDNAKSLCEQNSVHKEDHGVISDEECKLF